MGRLLCKRKDFYSTVPYINLERFKMARNNTEAGESNSSVSRCYRCQSRQGIDDDLYDFAGDTSHRVFEYLSDEVASELVCGACLREAIVHTDGDDPFPVSVYRAGTPETREVFSSYLCD